MKVAQLRRMSKKQSGQRRDQAVTINEEGLEDLSSGVMMLMCRRVLAFTMSKYDPLGLMAHFILTGKLMLQELYGKESSLSWDEAFPNNQQLRWQQCIQEAKCAPEVRIACSLLVEHHGQLWIVGFWDSSIYALASILYLRVQLRTPSKEDGGEDGSCASQNQSGSPVRFHNSQDGDTGADPAD